MGAWGRGWRGAARPGPAGSRASRRVSAGLVSVTRETSAGTRAVGTGGVGARPRAGALRHPSATAHPGPGAPGERVRRRAAALRAAAVPPPGAAASPWPAGGKSVAALPRVPVAARFTAPVSASGGGV